MCWLLRSERYAGLPLGGLDRHLCRSFCPSPLTAACGSHVDHLRVGGALFGCGCRASRRTVDGPIDPLNPIFGPWVLTGESIFVTAVALAAAFAGWRTTIASERSVVTWTLIPLVTLCLIELLDNIQTFVPGYLVINNVSSLVVALLFAYVMLSRSSATSASWLIVRSCFHSYRWCLSARSCSSSGYSRTGCATQAIRRTRS